MSEKKPETKETKKKIERSDTEKEARAIRDRLVSSLFLEFLPHYWDIADDLQAYIKLKLVLNGFTSIWNACIESNDEALLEMYLAFRKTMDDYCFPLIKEWATKQEGFITLYDANDDVAKRKPVGFLIVIDDYVDGIYVKPDYRRKGIAKKAVIDYLKSGGVIKRLHIIRTNTPALKFWKSIFVLEPENDCPVDHKRAASPRALARG